METIQLKTGEGKILYELEKSDLFPDFRSVLVDAITLNINLNELSIYSQNIDNIDWTGVKAKQISCTDCSMINNRFNKSNPTLFYMVNCNLKRLKIKNSIIECFYMDNCNLESSHLKNSQIKTAFCLDCDFTDTLFLDCKIESTSFNSSNLNNTTFNKCTLDISVVHIDKGNEWYKGLTFNACEFIINDINWQDIKDISLLYLWDFSDLSILRKLTDQRFTAFQNSETKLLYGVDAKTIWWQPLYKEPLKKYKPHRFTVEEFLNEVYNDFPTTDVYPYMEDHEIEFELVAFCEYVKIMHKNLCDIESGNYSW